MSTTEAIYHGVPLVGIPVFGDQQLNMAKAVAGGFALQLNFHDLTEEAFGSTLHEVLNNKKSVHSIDFIEKFTNKYVM